MRKFALLMIFLLVVFPAAAKRVTVAQLEQVLVIASAAHKSDADMVRQIDGMDLSERLTETTLDRLTAQLALGAQAALALRLLADQSAFLNPPNSELPPTAAPDDAAQQRMLDAAETMSRKHSRACPTFSPPAPPTVSTTPPRQSMEMSGRFALGCTW